VVIVHGRIVPSGDGRIDIEEHHHRSKDGSWRVTTTTYTLKRLIGIGNDVARAAGLFVAFNRRYLSGLPATWLDRSRP
jgi:hypothetical protein